MGYRILSRTEIGQLVEMDRTETVDYVYRLYDGKLRLEKEHWDVADWDASEKQRRIAELQKGYDHGDTLFGAFDGSKLVGISVLDEYTLPKVAGRFNLAGLWVSRAYRGQGVGRTLVALVMDKARELGAKTLYTSGTHSENTVRFYLPMGFHLADPVDPDLFEAEPEDIHMERDLW